MGYSMYKKFEIFMQERNLSPYKVSKEARVSQPTLSDWKRGKSEPKRATLEKICKAYDLPLTYFYDEEDGGGETYYLNEETAQIAQEIFENKDLRLLFDASRKAKPEDLKLAHDMLMALKRKENGDID